jgi:hypothetical protein
MKHLDAPRLRSVNNLIESCVLVNNDTDYDVWSTQYAALLLDVLAVFDRQVISYSGRVGSLVVVLTFIQKARCSYHRQP